MENKKLNEIRQMLAIVPIVRNMKRELEDYGRSQEIDAASTTIGLNAISEICFLNDIERRKLIADESLKEFVWTHSLGMADIVDTILSVALKIGRPEECVEILQEMQKVKLLGSARTRQDVEQEIANGVFNYISFYTKGVIVYGSAPRYLKLMSNEHYSDWVKFVQPRQDRSLNVNKVLKSDGETQYIEGVAVQNGCNVEAIGRLLDMNKEEILSDEARIFEFVRECAWHGRTDCLDLMYGQNEFSVAQAKDGISSIRYLEKRYAPFYAMLQAGYASTADQVIIQWTLNRIAPENLEEDMKLMKEVNLKLGTSKKELVDILLNEMEKMLLSHQFKPKGGIGQVVAL